MSGQTGEPSSPDSAALYAACHSTDALVQATAYETLWRYLYRVALQMVRRRPDAEALAQDNAQIALVRVHEHLGECQEPAAFRTWAKRITCHVVIDDLRRRQRLIPLAEDETEDVPVHLSPDNRPSVEATVLQDIRQRELRHLLDHAPISARSRRVLVGRYLEDLPDEQLAEAERRLAGERVLPSHVQVTRAKDIARLRSYAPLRAFLEIGD